MIYSCYLKLIPGSSGLHAKTRFLELTVVSNGLEWRSSLTVKKNSTKRTGQGTPCPFPQRECHCCTLGEILHSVERQKKKVEGIGMKSSLSLLHWTVGITFKFVQQKIEPKTKHALK